jgi:DNA invertase Pin-like site-specific DNA recombinase
MKGVGQRDANRLTRDRSTGDGPMTKILTRATTAQTDAAPTGRRWGYGRCSTEHQQTDQQRTQLEAAGCIEVITEQISSGRKDRPGLAKVLGSLERGDQLVVCKLDRLARSLVELLTIAADLEARGVDLVILDQAIDTSTNTGRLLFSMLGAVAEFERSLAIERTRASVAHRRSMGADLGGRRRSYSDAQIQLGHRLRAEGQSISQIAQVLNLSRGTTHRLLQELEQAS